MRTDNFLRGRRRDELSDDELRVLEAAIVEERDVGPRQTIVHAGDPLDTSLLLLEGLMCRYMDDREGRRQLVALHIAGDFVDLHGFPLGRLDHDVATLTAVRVAVVPHDRLRTIVEQQPHLTQLLWFSTLLDAAMHREWIFRLGRLGALGRVAHFFSETNVRLEQVGLSDGRQFALPMTQIDLSEACGLTHVHVNRVLRELREMDVLTFRGDRVTILERDKLETIAEFDPAYLYLTGR